MHMGPFSAKIWWEKPVKILPASGVRLVYYRGFKRKADRVLSYNINVVANQRYGHKRCSNMLGSILDLYVGSLQWSWWSNYCSFARYYTNLKIPHTNKFVCWLPIVSSMYRCLYQFCYVQLFSTNQNKNLLLLDKPGRVRSQIASIVCLYQTSILILINKEF